MILKITIGFFLASGLYEVFSFLFVPLKRVKIGIFLLFAGWLFLSLFLILRWREAMRAPLSNQYESLLFLLWAVLGLYFLFLSISPILKSLSPWVSGFAIFVMALTSLLNPAIEPLMPALQSNWLLVHVSSTLLGYASLALAFLGGLVYVLSRNSLRQDDILDPFLYRACALGFWLLTFGVVTGAVWANAAWGSYWSWDSKETWSLITWIFYAIAIHLRRTRGWRGKRFAYLMLAGFAFVVFTYFGVNYLLSGLHSYA